MKIHETAFIISTYRSYHEDISKDVYAKLWNNPATDILIPNILKNISPQESILHSIRNRFFYEKMKSFFNKNREGILINFGSGFSLYQFLLNKTIDTIEIDKKEIIAYKKEKIDTWTTNGKLPKRNTQYISFDFNLDSEEHMISILKPMIKNKPTFILLEGVLFFLDQSVSNKLFRVFKELQNTNDIVGSVSYLPEIERTEVYKRLLNYFDSNNDTNDSFSHQTIPNSYYTDLDGYQLYEHTDEYNQSKTYAPKSNINDINLILNEHMYILERN